MRRYARLLRTIGTVAAAVTVIGGSLLPTAALASSSLPDGVFLACPDHATLATISSPTCQTLGAAITAAETWNQTSRTNATIELLPGQYCPQAIPYDSYDVTIQGLGFAGLANASEVSSYTGFESTLSTFTWISGTCTGSLTAYLSNLPNPAQPSEIWGDVTLHNFAVAGIAGGPTTGVAVGNAALDARDLLVENVSGTGLSWTDDYNFYNGGMENSAFVSDGTGTQIHAGTGHGFSIDKTTYTTNGIAISSSGNVNIGFDTVAHNTTGLSGSFSQVVGSIVGDNTTNCSATYSDFGDSVYGPGCTGTDTSLTSTLGSATTTGPAITPSIAPPSEAAGLVEAGLCGSLDKTDQEERDVTSLSTCDAGAVQPAGTISDPMPSPSPQDFGGVPTNQPASASVYFGGGGDVVGVNGVDVATTSGTGNFSINFSTCTFDVLVDGTYGAGQCMVSVQATATQPSGVTHGTLTFHTSKGDIVDTLTMTGAKPIAPPAAPTHLGGTAANRSVSLTWTATPDADDGGQPIQFYAVQESADGSHWAVVDSTYDLSETMNASLEGLTNNHIYRFRVVANNGFADSPPSNVVSVTPEGPATKISAPAKAKVVEGHPSTLTTRLIDAGSHAGISGALVHLQKKVGSGSFTSAGTATTTGSGAAHLSVTPTRNTTYRWVFSGSGTHAPSTSPGAQLTVAQAVTAKLSPKVVHHGDQVVIYGTVAPAGTHRSVILQIKSKGIWKKLATDKQLKQRMPNGKREVGYTFTIRTHKVGKEKLRVTSPATTSNAAGASKTVTLKVT